ncbi:MAG: EAL domain-containing protein [Rhodocyclaceae bacterium]|nr:EAL domain-containing protein [Rhodocyclaceae bacterium]
MATRNSLELEILETAAIEDVQRVASVLRECQAMGVALALDDFGTGYSSLSYLKLLPVGNAEDRQELRPGEAAAAERGVGPAAA